MSTLTQTQLAYLAGLIDGEGSLESQRQLQKRGQTHRYSLRISFVFATEEPLKTIGGWLGIEAKRYPARDATRSPRWRASIPKNQATPILEACLPYLILKRRQAELILQIEAVRAEYSPSRAHTGKVGFQRVPETAVEQMEALHIELRSLKCNKRRMIARSSLGQR